MSKENSKFLLVSLGFILLIILVLNIVNLSAPKVIFIKPFEICCNELKIGEVYYDTNLNRFSQVRDKTYYGYIVTQARYYSDSKTTISEVPLSCLYTNKNLIYVYDVSKFAEYDGIGWRTENPT